MRPKVSKPGAGIALLPIDDDAGAAAQEEQDFYDEDGIAVTGELCVSTPKPIAATLFFVSFVYASGMPILYPMCMIGMLVSYWVDKITGWIPLAVAALGLNLLTGYNGQISVGHGAIYGTGAYTRPGAARDPHGQRCGARRPKLRLFVRPGGRSATPGRRSKLQEAWVPMCCYPFSPGRATSLRRGRFDSSPSPGAEACCVR